MKRRSGLLLICVIAFVLFMISLAALVTVAMAAGPKLVWDASSGPVDGYRVYWGTAAGVHPNSKDVGPKLEEPISDLNGLLPGTQYFFVVRAYNTAGESGDSNEVNYTTVAVPSAPGNVQIIVITN